MTTGIILHASLRTGRGDAAWNDVLLQALPYARRLQVTSSTEVAQRATLGGLALALHAAERVAGRTFSPRAFAFPQDGKPCIESGPCFSVSHAGARVAVVASSRLEVGLDIEDWSHGGGTASLQKLMRLTATEAVLKAQGLGLREFSEVTLAASLASAVLRGKRYELCALRTLPEVTGYVAAPAQADWAIEEIDLDSAEFSVALERSLRLSSQVE